MPQAPFHQPDSGGNSAASVTGLVHSVESCGTVDGPGIRFVLFLSGCSLRCRYCHNPAASYVRRGQTRSAADILEELARYRDFLQAAGGGLTLSGGDPLFQPAFAKAVLKGGKAMGLHTCLDTSGHLGANADGELLEHTDLVLLDIMLPKLDGLSVLRQMRSEGVQTPVLMLTARTTVPDKVAGLNAGADDYLTKPFDPEELLARVGAMTRRKGAMVLNKISFQDLTLDLNTVTLRCGARDVQLSPKEFALARLMLAEPGMTYSKDLLISRAWGLDSEATDNNVEAYISFLRKKLRYLGSKVSIKNLQKIGYRLEVAP